jgi:hypothetical protein
MASEFIGLHMVVTLKDPSGMQLKGTISDISISAGESGQRAITLSNGMAAYIPHPCPLVSASSRLLTIYEHLV